MPCNKPQGVDNMLIVAMPYIMKTKAFTLTECTAKDASYGIKTDQKHTAAYNHLYH